MTTICKRIRCETICPEHVYNGDIETFNVTRVISYKLKNYKESDIKRIFFTFFEDKQNIRSSLVAEEVLHQLAALSL